MWSKLSAPPDLIDPTIEIKPIKNQVDDLIERIKERVTKHQRVLVATLTKRMAEELTEYLKEDGIKVQYIHSDVDTFERLEILRDLRLGVYDVLVGINLLREGLDLPEVSLVAILDADKEGFLRSETFFMQMMGRAARHLGRPRGNVCRQNYRLYEARYRRNHPPPQASGSLQQKTRHYPQIHPKSHSRFPHGRQ